MKRGLVIGKFLPPHKGHIALIEFAARQCEELIVSMSFTKNDAIPAYLRLSWLKEIFEDSPHIKPEMVEDNFDDETLPLVERTRIWAAFIRKRFPPIDIIFSSEDYGDPFAKHLDCEHVRFDQLRNKVAVSASLIRKSPYKYWDFIPGPVKPYYVKKICLYGPESTGKSIMAMQLAEQYNTTYVPEVAREMLTKNEFSVEDIIQIGHAHYNRINKNLKTADKIIFCDTDAITTQIYAQHYLATIPPVLYELEEKIKYDIYFLFDIDVPWVPDGLRDLPHRRQEMFSLFRHELEKRNIPYILVSGDWKERKNIITKAVNQLLQ
jgi:HTH-type transcriptional regulator, transcriptional repressor of NAD biosynthesis genes